MREKIEEVHLREYLIAVCEHFFTDFKKQEQCSDWQVMAVVLSALANTSSTMALRIKEF